MVPNDVIICKKAIELIRDRVTYNLLYIITYIGDLNDLEQTVIMQNCVVMINIMLMRTIYK